jgi:bifunctional UDP-N-acetylglucosamine pyrophosphorylase/glucosamine-1-phosphate N-acetyltransferase
MIRSRVLVIPAAGRGVRLGAHLPKVLVPVAGRPMLEHLLALHAPFVSRIVIVASPDARAQVATASAGAAAPVDVVEQAQPTGMLDAILIGCGTPAVADRTWITWGDQVGVQHGTLERLAAIDPGSDLALPTVARDEPYIHFDRDGAGRIVAVRQRREGDPMPAHGESDMGLFSLSPRAVGEWLPEYARTVSSGSGTGERNFLPFVAWAAARGPVATCTPLDARESIGINTPAELAAMDEWMRTR